MSKPCSISIILPDGDPDGIRCAEIGTSSIKVIAFHKSQFENVRPAILRPGVYLLYGQDPITEDKTVYIGESDDVAARLKFHKGNAKDPKDYWEETVVVVSQTDNLIKSHVRYIEAKLIAAASNKVGWKLANAKLTSGKLPKAATLPQAETIKMEEFIEQAMLLARTVGCDLFKVTSGQLVQQAINSGLGAKVLSPEFRFSGSGFAARAVVSSISGDWIVKAQSTAKSAGTKSLPVGIKKLRTQLQEAGTLKMADGGLIFQEDCSFLSASSAASVVSGTPTDGRNKAWKLESGKTFAEWEAEQAASVPDTQAGAG